MKVRQLYDPEKDERIENIASDILLLALKLPREEISRIDLIQQVHELSTWGVAIIDGEEDA